MFLQNQIFILSLMQYNFASASMSFYEKSNMYTVSVTFTFLRNHFSEKSNMDAVFKSFVVYVLFYFSEKSLF